MLCKTARHYHWGTAGAVTTRPSPSLAGRTLHAGPSISSPSSTTLGLGDRWCCHNTSFPLRPSNIARRSKISSLSLLSNVYPPINSARLYIALQSKTSSLSSTTLRLGGWTEYIVSRFYKVFWFFDIISFSPILHVVALSSQGYESIKKSIQQVCNKAPRAECAYKINNKAPRAYCLQKRHQVP